MNRKGMNYPKSDYRFLPGYYLAGFAQGYRLEDKLWVLDRKLGLGIVTNPREAAREPEASRPGAGFSLADRMASIINRIAEDQTLPSGGDFALLMDFTAAMLLNLPAPRQMAERFADQLAEKVLSLADGSKEGYQGFFSRVEASGIKVPTFEEASEVLQSDKYTTPEDRRGFIRGRFNLTRLALAQIKNRSWSVIINGSHDHPFITSDLPLLLVSPSKSGYCGPNLRSPDTDAFLPLSQRVMLKGGVGEAAETSRINGVREVARLNSLVVEGRGRYIFSSKENFVYLNDLKRLSFKDKLIIESVKTDKKKPRG